LWSPGNQGWLTLACLINRYLPLFGHIPLAVSYLRSQRDIPVRLRFLTCITATNHSTTSVVSYRDAWLDEQKLINPAQLSGFTSLPRDLWDFHAGAGWPYVPRLIILDCP
jgi:hypothetical protein